MTGPRPVVLSGPPGAGKTTLLKRLLKEYEGVFGFSTSHATRNVRHGEEEGRGLNCLPMLLGATLLPVADVLSSVSSEDYHFVSREVHAGSENGDFIEQEEHGKSNLSIQDVQAQNLICIINIDVHDVRNMKKTDLNPIYVSIQPPSIEILEKRLRDRQTETDESVQKHLEVARIDMELSQEPGLFDVVIINDDLEEAYEKLKEVLIEEITKVQEDKKSSETKGSTV